MHSGYVGRRREVQRLVPALRQGETTFAVLTGIGGTGKSTLATRAANRLQVVGYGVIPVKVTSRPTPAEAGRDVASRLIGALDEAFLAIDRKDLHARLTDGEIPTGQRLKMAVRGLNELKLVLVLDNFEDALDLETRRIADPDLASFIEALAKNLTQGSRAILTCRYLPEGTPVDLTNVLHLPLPEFPAHDALKFLRRDDLVDKRISRGELTGNLINRLYQALGGTPGLLGQVRTLLRKADPDDLLEELEGGDPGMIAREREAYCSKILTNRLYAALSLEAQAITRRLALSSLPLPIDAAATLAYLTEPEVVGPLEEGVAYGLLQKFDDPDHPPLYHPPGLLRPWLAAPERIAEGEANTVHALLAVFWRASLLASRESELRVTTGAALEACCEHSMAVEDVSGYLWGALMRARLMTASNEWNQARSLLEAVGEENRDADIWYELATIDLNQGDYQAAREKFNTSMQLGQINGGRADEACTWQQLGLIDLKQGDYSAAREKYHTAMQISRAIGDLPAQAAAWHNLATIDLNQGDYNAAREKFVKSLEFKRAIGDRAAEAVTWHNLASIDLNQGDYQAAREKFEFSMQISRTIGDCVLEAATWQQLATIDSSQGDYSAAREKLESAMQISLAIGDRSAEAAAWYKLATIDLNQSDYQAAREKFESSMQISLAIGDRAFEAATWQQLATIDSSQGDYQAAREKFESAMHISRDIGNRSAEAAAWHNLATIDLNQGDYQAARDKFESATQISRDIGERPTEAATWNQLGIVAYETGRAEVAVQFIAIAFHIGNEIGNSDGRTIARNIDQLCSDLGLNQTQVDAILKDAITNYQEDGGRGLIERAFAARETGGPDDDRA